jgi:hypothetical protein
MFALINGDDMFATFYTISDKTPPMVLLFSRVYLVLFISLFIYVVLSLFISIIMDAYEVVKVRFQLLIMCVQSKFGTGSIFGGGGGEPTTSVCRRTARDATYGRLWPAATWLQRHIGRCSWLSSGGRRLVGTCGWRRTDTECTESCATCFVGHVPVSEVSARRHCRVFNRCWTDGLTSIPLVNTNKSADDTVFASVIIFGRVMILIFILQI